MQSNPIVALALRHLGWVCIISIILYFVIAGIVMPKGVDPMSAEGTRQGNIVVQGFMLLMVVWIGIAIYYGVKHPPCSQPGVSCTNQTYWYCWDSGPPEPHHLGHPVSGDHLCTSQELGGSGQ